MSMNSIYRIPPIDKFGNLGNLGYGRRGKPVMSAVAFSAPFRLSLNDAAVAARVKQLRKPDNITNWFHLAHVYLYLITVVGLPVAFYLYREDWGLSWAWNLPVTFLAVVLIGAGQHRLTTLGHEASHYMLFRHRLLNELASDFLCMFPVWSTTHHYRLQHLAHHQFPNDPERDPDVTQMKESGHRYDFPMSPRRFMWVCVVKQLLWLPGLIRYIRVRARYASTGEGSGPYEAQGPRSHLLSLIGALYFLLLFICVGLSSYLNAFWLLALIPPALAVPLLIFYAVVPGRLYRHTKLKPDVSPRSMTLLRVSYLTILLTALGWLTYATGHPWLLYYLLLWALPLATAFSFFMLLRQVVQHGNTGSARLTNTRVFLVSRLIRFAVFPLGMDYHLPHHLYPMVPHFRLKELHEFLLQTEEYRREAVLVGGYFWPDSPPRETTVLDVMARSNS
jgi:fatty acid desaturase